MILLDTHVLVWVAGRPDELSRAAAAAVRREHARDALAIAAVTLFELAQLVAHGRVRPVGTPREWLRALVSETGVAIKELTPEIALDAAHLPADFLGDPFDRLIVATARAHGCPLVTADRRIRASGLTDVLW